MLSWYVTASLLSMFLSGFFAKFLGEPLKRKYNIKYLSLILFSVVVPSLLCWLCNWKLDPEIVISIGIALELISFIFGSLIGELTQKFFIHQGNSDK